jgi:hypothetical protein
MVLNDPVSCIDCIVISTFRFFLFHGNFASEPHGVPLTFTPETIITTPQLRKYTHKRVLQVPALGECDSIVRHYNELQVGR